VRISSNSSATKKKKKKRSKKVCLFQGYKTFLENVSVSINRANHSSNQVWDLGFFLFVDLPSTGIAVTEPGLFCPPHSVPIAEKTGFAKERVYLQGNL
jgi:hypothetical protein